jgi:2-polyprenyl-6-methoxyphenol hydroxylase-like FAD-dependent oxidoreductase
VTGVERSDGAEIVSAVAEPGGEPVRIGCKFAAGCDGARSALLGAIRHASVVEWQHPFRWLTLLVDAAPSKPRTLYGFHVRGFAGQMRRGPSLTRFMLEVPRADTLEDWPEDRVWPELAERAGGVRLPVATRSATTTHRGSQPESLVRVRLRGRRPLTTSSRLRGTSERNSLA